MSSIQGVSGSPAPSYTSPTVQSRVTKSEAQESAQSERTETQRGTQEMSERSSAPVSDSSVGTRFSATA